MQRTLNNRKITNAKPFLKWAGGKTQLLEELDKRLPKNIIEDGIIENYVEPFVGGGAMFFYLKKKYDVKNSCILDVNPELVIGYISIKKSAKKLIKILEEMEEEYLIKSDGERSIFYYQIRDSYNDEGKTFNYQKYRSCWVDRVAKLIFLNKTCFNGLFRQNSKGEFNVPFGKYKNPTICDEANIIEVSKALRDTLILCGDFEESIKNIKNGTLVYLDPPYRPLNITSSFTDYAKNGFGDGEQIRLADFFRKMDKRDAYLMLSNSDPKNINLKDDFFDNLYKGYHINRVLANRNINCIGSKRGQINELIITNY
jgi:DNA adenine methylase